MARRLAVELAEVLDLLDRQVIAGQVQQRIQQHRAVAVGNHEAVAVEPLRVGRVVLQEVVPEHLGDVRHPHRHAGVPRVGLLHRIHGQGADGVGELEAGGHLRGFRGHQKRTRIVHAEPTGGKEKAGRLVKAAHGRPDDAVI
jgi:hypothetical protein